MRVQPKQKGYLNPSSSSSRVRLPLRLPFLLSSGPGKFGIQGFMRVKPKEKGYLNSSCSSGARLPVRLPFLVSSDPGKASACKFVCLCELI